jgi:hypothetical protein
MVPIVGQWEHAALALTENHNRLKTTSQNNFEIAGESIYPSAIAWFGCTVARLQVRTL